MREEARELLICMEKEESNGAQTIDDEDEEFTCAYDFDASRAVLVRLAHGVFEALRRDGKGVIAKCPVMSSYAARHPEYGALLDG